MPSNPLSDHIKLEDQFLISCLRYQLHKNEDVLAESDNIPSGFNWQYVLDIAQYHHVVPQLFLVVDKYFKNSIPDEIYNKINQLYKNIVANNLFLTTELFKILEIFEKSSINAVPFKGPVLSSYLYNEIGLRQFVDIDILIKRKDIDEAERILFKYGYLPFYPLDAKRHEIYKNYVYSVGLRKSSPQILVDLHFSLISPNYSFAPDIEAVFRNLSSVKLEGRSLKSIDDLELLNFLCVHGAKHKWELLIWFLDLALLCKNKNINWDKVLVNSEEQGTLRFTLLGAILVNELLLIKLPSKVLDSARRDKKVIYLLKIVKENIFKDSVTKNKYFIGERFYLMTMEKLSDKFRFVFDILFKPTYYELNLIRIPKSLSFLYFIIRPFRLAVKYMSKAFN